MKWPFKTLSPNARQSLDHGRQTAFLYRFLLSFSFAPNFYTDCENFLEILAHLVFSGVPYLILLLEFCRKAIRRLTSQLVGEMPGCYLSRGLPPTGILCKCLTLTGGVGGIFAVPPPNLYPRLPAVTKLSFCGVLMTTSLSQVLDA